MPASPEGGTGGGGSGGGGGKSGGVPSPRDIRRFIRSMERVDSPASRAQARLFGRLVDIRDRYLFATSEAAGADVEGLLRLIKGAHRVSRERRGKEPTAAGRSLDDIYRSLGTLARLIDEFNSIPVREWKRKMRGAERVAEPLGSLRVSARRLSYYAEFRLIQPVIDGWRRDAGSTGRFYRKLGKLLDEGDNEGIQALDLRGLDRSRKAVDDADFVEQMEQLEEMKIGVILGKGGDPARTYARMLLLEDGQGLAAGAGAAGGDADGGGSGSTTLRVIMGAFRGMLVTMIAIAYLPLVILLLAGGAGVETSGSDLLGMLVSVQLALAFIVPGFFLLWALSGAGFDLKGISLMDTRVLWAAATTAVVVAVVGLIQTTIMGLGDAPAALVVLGCAIMAVSGLQLAGEDVTRGSGIAPALTRYGLSHLVSLPLAALVVIITSPLHLGGFTADDTLLGMPAVVHIGAGGLELAVYPALMLVLSFAFSAVGSIASAVSKMR